MPSEFYWTEVWHSGDSQSPLWLASLAKEHARRDSQQISAGSGRLESLPAALSEPGRRLPLPDLLQQNGLWVNAKRAAACPLNEDTNPSF
jgi:hypothetical protein